MIIYYSRPSSYYSSIFDEIVLNSLYKLDPFVLINPGSENFPFKDEHELYEYITNTQITHLFYLKHANYKVGYYDNMVINASKCGYKNCKIFCIDWDCLFLNHRFYTHEQNLSDINNIMNKLQTNDQLNEDYNAIIARQ